MVTSERVLWEDNYNHPEKYKSEISLSVVYSQNHGVPSDFESTVEINFTKGLTALKQISSRPKENHLTHMSLIYLISKVNKELTILFHPKISSTYQILFYWTMWSFWSAGNLDMYDKCIAAYGRLLIIQTFRAPMY